MKQQFKGSLTLNVAAREIALQGIELAPDQVMLVFNATAGHIYHNFYADDPAQITISSAIVSASPYDSIASFSGLYSIFQDGIDKGGVLDITGGVATVVSSGSGYRSGLVTTSGGTRLVIDVNKSTTIHFAPFKDCDPHNDTDEVAVFYDDRVYLDELIESESNETQTLISTEFGTTRTQLTAFQTEVKAEFDETQTLIPTEFETTRTQLTAFQTEVKDEFDETQTLINSKIPTAIETKVPVEGVDTFGDARYSSVVSTKRYFGPETVSFSRSSAPPLQVAVQYDQRGNITSVTPV